MKAFFLKAVRLVAWTVPAVLLYLGPMVVAALAHASLMASTPPDAAVLQDVPKTIVLRFSEPVTPLVARLIHPGGRTEILRDDGGQGATVTYTLPAVLEHGTHILSWRVTSEDGHPVGGGQLFSIGAPSATGGYVGTPADIGVALGIWGARLLLMLGLIFGLGSSVFTALSGINISRGTGRLIPGLTIIGLLAAPALIGLQGLDALGEPMPSLLKASVWKAGLWSTAYGPATLVAAAALALSLLGHQAGPRTRRWFLAAVLVIAGTAFASAGHASTAPPRFLTTPAVFLHTLSVILWIGALIPLADVLRRPSESGAAALRQFSSLISPVIFVLVFTGLFLAVVQLQHLSALRSTEYGLVLVAKVALVLIILALAAYNRYRLSDGAIVGEASAVRHLRRSIVVEMVLSLAIIAILGLWRFTPPPREASSTMPPSQTINIAAEGLTARLTMLPATVGAVSVQIDDLQLDGKPIVPMSMTLDLSKPAYGIGPFVHDATREGSGHYVVRGNLLPIDGFWVVKLTVLISDFRSIIATDLFDVRRPVARNTL